MTAQPRSGPCVGLKVLDVSSMVSGPLCGQMLGDMGADVVKLESLDGDPLRQSAPRHKDLSAYFCLYNRSKRSIAVDLKTDRGRSIAQKMAEHADVLIENYRPGVASRLGMDYETLSAMNPGLVYVSIKGFGEDGPDKDLPAYDPVIQALVGFMPVQGGEGPPQAIANSVADKIASVSGVNAALAALYARDRSGGRGQKVVVKMIDAWASFILHDEMRHRMFMDSDAPSPPRSGAHRTFKAKDGYVTALAIQDSQFVGITKVVNRPDLLDDERFARLRERMWNTNALNDELARSMETMTVAELTAAAREYDVPLAKVHTIDEFIEHPQVRHNNTFPVLTDPEYGRMRGLACPAEFRGTPVDLDVRAPALGEQTREILAEAGVASEEVDKLFEAGVVR